MKAALPDISLTEASPALSPLDWVGMQGIDLPVLIVEPNYRRELHGRVDVQVDLPSPHIKGIHMSRLYRALDLLADEALSPARIKDVLQAMVASHQDCGSHSARLVIHSDLLVRRTALVTEDLSGWKAYPISIQTSLLEGVFSLRIEVVVGYSSTCPCSAALSRHLIEHQFLDAFAGKEQVGLSDAAAWLRQHGTLATPHSQRSEARISVTVPAESDALGFISLIDCIELALATPVQTAVKRADEQAFAALNGQNVMFVEDAARRIQAALADKYMNSAIHVRHQESLHPHDAVAWHGQPQTHLDL